MHGRSALPPVIFRAIAVFIGAVGLLVATRTGPHDDTFFEFARLLTASDLQAFLMAVAADNQPPLGPLLSYALLQIGVPIDALRLAVGVLLLTLLSWASFSGLQKLGWEHERAAYASGLFVVIVGWSPATAPVLVMLRYASLVLVAWVIAALAGFSALERGDHRADRRLGVVLGASLLASTTSIVLAGFWILVIAVGTRSIRRVGVVLSAASPFVALVAAWTVWAGPEFVANVIGRSTGRPSVRTVVGQTYEQSVWPILGIVSLPTPTVIVLGAVSTACVGLLVRESPRDRRWWIALAGILASIPAMVLTQVVNGGVAGPAAVLLLVASMAAVRVGRKSRFTPNAVFVMFALASATLLLYASLGKGVLRPYLWDGSGPEAAALVNETLLEFHGRESCVIDSGDYSTALLLGDQAIPLESPDLRACIEGSSLVIDVRGDHPARRKENEQLSALLLEDGFLPLSTTPVGLYPHSALRDRLGLRNLQDSHLLVTIHLREREP